ncbi:MAG: hypothetical protein OEV44_09580, partial [Spirochaetota bacterium]|nr:hypothetical protein [Spirochaetota bacterium]
MLLSEIKGIGKAKEGCLNKLNIFSKGDLLSHFPKRYEDRRICRSLKDYLMKQDNEQFPVEVKVLGYDFLYARGKRVLKIVISDGFMRASLICFNRDFLKTAMEEEKDYIVFGDFQYKYGEL